MARDKPDGRERREGRARDRGRERADDHDDRDGGDLRERLRAVETLATDTAHLASTSAFRFGGYTAQKGLVYFVSGDLIGASFTQMDRLEAHSFAGTIPETYREAEALEAPNL
eukprot:s5163_g3.t1